MRTHLLLLAFVVALALGACTSTIEVPKEVKVPTPVPCVADDKRPQRPDPVLRSIDDLLGMDRYRRTIASWSDLLRAEAYIAELEAVVDGCSKIPTKPP